MAQSQMQAAYYSTQQDKKDLLHAQQRIQTAREEEITGGVVVVGDEPAWDMDTVIKEN